MTIEDVLLQRACDSAIHAAEAAAKIIRAKAGSFAVGGVKEKALHDLVTETDEQSQEIIIEHLNKDFPQFDVLAEEGTDLAGMVPVAENYRWIIDPIDGTTNFTRGVPPYAVSIALQHGAEMVVGVVLDVPHNELFTAVRGGGLRVNGRRAAVSKTPVVAQSLVTTGFPYRSYDHLDAYLQVLDRIMREAHGVRRPGSAAVDMAWVASGRFDAFFETGLSPWDSAAGQVLITEAGGRVTNFSGGENPSFTRQMLATNGLLHEEMMQILRPLQLHHALE